MIALAFWLLARLAYVTSYTDPVDHVSCDVYRVGAHEVNVCAYEQGWRAEGPIACDDATGKDLAP